MFKSPVIGDGFLSACKLSWLCGRAANKPLMPLASGMPLVLLASQVLPAENRAEQRSINDWLAGCVWPPLGDRFLVQLVATVDLTEYREGPLPLGSRRSWPLSARLDWLLLQASSRTQWDAGTRVMIKSVLVPPAG